MPSFQGLNHFALSVTDVARSEAFYSGVLGFFPLMRFEGGLVLIDVESSFTIALLRHPEARGGEFSELTTGLDHLGLVAADVAELEDWARRFDAAGVTYTPIRELPFGHHLNFRDPDNIPLEFFVPNDLLLASYQELREREVSREEIDARIAEVVGEQL